MKETNQEVDYVEAIFAMRTLLSLNKDSPRKMETSYLVSFEIADYDSREKSITKQT